MSSILVEIVTPEKKVYAEQASMILVKGSEGELGILPNHIPMITPLKIGPVVVKKEQGTDEIAVHGGFMEVRKDKVIILAESAELPQDIDVERAAEAKERAEHRLQDAKQDHTDFRRAEMALQRALTRINVSHHHNK